MKASRMNNWSGTRPVGTLDREATVCSLSLRVISAAAHGS
jgi:hypothetical protein